MVLVLKIHKNLQNHRCYLPQTSTSYDAVSEFYNFLCSNVCKIRSTIQCLIPWSKWILTFAIMIMILLIILPIWPKCSTRQLNQKTMTPKFDPNELLKFFTQGKWRVMVVLLRLILSFLFQWKQPYKNVSQNTCSCKEKRKKTKKPLNAGEEFHFSVIF